MASRQDMGLMVAATDGVRPGTTWLYFALYRFPIHSAPLLLQTALERKHETPTQASQERPPEPALRVCRRIDLTAGHLRVKAILLMTFTVHHQI